MPHDELPPNDGPRNFYDPQFADRINRITKPGVAPAPSGGAGGWGAKGLGGGVAFAILIGVRLLFAFMRTSSTPTYQPPPPPITVPPPIHFQPIQQRDLPGDPMGQREDQPKPWNQPGGPFGPRDERFKRWNQPGDPFGPREDPLKRWNQPADPAWRPPQFDPLHPERGGPAREKMPGEGFPGR